MKCQPLERSKSSPGFFFPCRDAREGDKLRPSIDQAVDCLAEGVQPRGRWLVYSTTNGNGEHGKSCEQIH